MATSSKKSESLSAFGEKASPPSDRLLQSTLGAAGALWRDLVARISATYSPVTEQWNYSGTKFGWSLRLKQRDRIVLYLTPQRGQFLVGLVLGPKAVAAAGSSGLPASVRTALAEAPRFAEGTGLRLAVTHASDLGAVIKLAELKMSA